MVGRLAGFLAGCELRDVSYFEPFLGAGSLFFHMEPAAAVIGDANPDLMLFYAYLRDQPRELMATAVRIADGEGKREYLAARDEFNDGSTGLRRAALFFYLNRTGFNGIWRVNRRGIYTVPYGERRLAALSDERLLRLSAVLARASLSCGDYVQTVSSASAGDVVYFDPPYLSSSKGELFSRYTPVGFRWRDHVSLNSLAHKLSGEGVNVLITVRDHPLMRSMYEGWKIESVETRDVVGGGAQAIAVCDLVIRNFG